jgi:hypothetical protein
MYIFGVRSTMNPGLEWPGKTSSLNLPGLPVQMLDWIVRTALSVLLTILLSPLFDHMLDRGLG